MEGKSKEVIEMAKELSQFTKRYVILKGYENIDEEFKGLKLDEAIKQNILYIECNQDTGDIVGTYGVEGPVNDISRSSVTGDIKVDYNKP